MKPQQLHYRLAIDVAQEDDFNAKTSEILSECVEKLEAAGFKYGLFVVNPEQEIPSAEEYAKAGIDPGDYTAEGGHKMSVRVDLTGSMVQLLLHTIITETQTPIDLVMGMFDPRKAAAWAGQTVFDDILSTAMQER